VKLFHYALQRRCLAADCALPLHPASAAGDPDLVLRLRPEAPPRPVGIAPWYRADAASIDRGADGDAVMTFDDGTSFLIRRDGREIALLAAPREYTGDDLAAYALGPVAAVALHLQGAVLLHAAAVAMRGKAVVFAGDSGSGKSTTAARLSREGYEVLAEDVAEVEGNGPWSVAGLAGSIRLWPDAVEAIFGPDAQFADRAPSWDKKLVRIGGGGPGEPREIAAILFLDAADRGEARLTRLAPKDGWLRLIAAAYTARLPDPAMSRRIFEVTSALADSKPMFALTLPPPGEGLGAFLERELAGLLR
jgi:hypothetical protein